MSDNVRLPPFPLPAPSPTRGRDPCPVLPLARVIVALIARGTPPRPPVLDARPLLCPESAESTVMYDFCVSPVYGGVLALGGVWGGYKGSWISLAAGLAGAAAVGEPSPRARSKIRAPLPHPGGDGSARIPVSQAGSASSISPSITRAT